MANYFEQFLDTPAGGDYAPPEEERRQPNYFEQFLDQPSPPPVQQQQQVQPVEQPQPNYFAQFLDQPEPPKEPQAEGMLGTVARAAAHSVLPSAAFYPGFTATTTAAAPFLGPAAPLAGVVGGMATSYLASRAQETGAKALGFDDSQQLAVNAAANPWSATAGDIAGALPSFGVGKGAQLAARGVGALAGGGLEAGAQYLRDEELDPARIAGGAIAGGTLIRPRAAIEALGERAAALGAKVVPHGSAGSTAAAGTAEVQPPPSRTPDDLPQPPSGEMPPRGWVEEPPPMPGRPPAAQVFEGVDPAIDAAIKGTPISRADPLLRNRGFTPEQIGAMTEDQKLEILQQREGEAGSRPEPPAPITQQLEQEFPRVSGAERQRRPLVEEPPATLPTRRQPIGELLRQDIPTDPELLRQQAAQLREAGAEGIARQRELAADAIEKSRPPQQQQQQQTEPTLAYHGTTEPLDRFRDLGPPRENYMPDRMLGYHFARDPAVSNSFVMERINQQERGAKPGGRVLPVHLPPENTFLELHQPQYEWAVKEGQPRHNRNVETDQVAVAKAIAQTAYPQRPDILAKFLETRRIPPEEAQQLATALVRGETVNLPLDGPHNLDRVINNFTGAMPYERDLKRALVDTARQIWQDQGYKGIKYTNTSPMETMLEAGVKDHTSYIVFDPKDVRGRFTQQAQQKQIGGVMAARLKQRGYTPEQIKGMSQGAAREIIANDYLPQQAIERRIIQPERGITSPAAKGVDPATQQLIKDALAKRAAAADRPKTMAEIRAEDARRRAADPALDQFVREQMTRAREPGRSDQAMGRQAATEAPGEGPVARATEAAERNQFAKYSTEELRAFAKSPTASEPMRKAINDELSARTMAALKEEPQVRDPEKLTPEQAEQWQRTRTNPYATEQERVAAATQQAEDFVAANKAAAREPGRLGRLAQENDRITPVWIKDETTGKTRKFATGDAGNAWLTKQIQQAQAKGEQLQDRWYSIKGGDTSSVDPESHLQRFPPKGPRAPVVKREVAPAPETPPEIPPETPVRPDLRQAGEFRIEPKPEGGYNLMRGDQVVSEHKNIGQAYIAMNKATGPAPAEGPAARAPAGAGRKVGPLPAAAEPAGGVPPAGAPATPVPAPGAGQPAARARGRPPKQQPTPAAQPAPAAAGAPPGAVPPAAPPPGAPPPAAGPPPSPPAPRQPRLQAATDKDLADSWWASAVRTIAPETRPSGRQGMDVFRKMAGLADRMYQTQKARFTDDVWRAVNQTSEMDQRKFINYIQGGKELQTPGHDIYDPTWAPRGDLLAAAKDIRKNMLEWRKEIASWPQAAQDKFRDNYLNQEWQELQANVRGRGGVGGKGHLRERVFENDEAGRAAGYTPTTTNPLERWNNYALAMGRTAVEFKTQTALEKAGQLGWFTRSNPNVRGGPPKGYAPVNGWEKPNGAQAYVPVDMAAMLNNQFAPHGGFRSIETQNLADSVRRFKNFSTAAELSLSLYHPFTTAFETAAGGIGRAVTQLGTGPGSTQRAIQSLGHAMLDPIHPILQLLPEATRKSLNLPEALGKEWIERYKGQRPSTPEQRKLMNIMTEAGIRPVGTGHTLDFDLQKMGGRGSLFEAWRRGSLGQELGDAWENFKGPNAPKVAVNLAGRVLQDLATPVFQHYVPILKMSSMVRDMQAYMAANPGATREQLVDIMRQFSDSADNRIGEMVADHMGMNKAVKNIANTALRSFSFTVGGPIREIIPGAAAPFREAAKGAAQAGPQAGIIGAVKGGAQRAAGTLNMASDSYNRKTGYLLGYAVLAGLVGTAMNYIRTGEYPQDWRDIVTPRTGGMVSSGGQIVPERVLLPGYHKDFLGYAYHPGSEARAKLAAPWSEMLDQTVGDYRGDPIVPPASAIGLPANIAERAVHAAARYSPLSFKTTSEPPKAGSNISTFERALGFRAPGAYIQNPERIEQVKDIVARKEWRTRERHENDARRAQGLPPLPPRQFREPEMLPRQGG